MKKLRFFNGIKGQKAVVVYDSDVIPIHGTAARQAAFLFRWV